MKLRHKILIALLLISVFLILPIFGIGAIWVQHVGLLPGTAVVFPSNAAAMDMFMAAALKPYYGDRVGICDGTNDHVEVQAALDAVSEVRLSEGTFNCEVTIDLVSNQTLRGCGRNTILTTSTNSLTFLSAVGASGTEKTGIIIKDLKIDGSGFGNKGIYFHYTDYSLVQNIYSIKNSYFLGGIGAGIQLSYSDFNTITQSNFEENMVGIRLDYSNGNIISGSLSSANTNYSGIQLEGNYNIVILNHCSTNNLHGIHVGGENNIVMQNVCEENLRNGIYSDSNINSLIAENLLQGNTWGGIWLNMSNNYNIIAENNCQGNGYHGICLNSANNDNSIIGNICIGDSQSATNTYDEIYVATSDRNTIQHNVCRAGTLTNKPRYGININNALCDKNYISNNDLHNDGFVTKPFNDAGTLTTVEDNNRGITIDQIKIFRYMKNTSGAQRVAGDVVSLKAVAAGNEVTAPAAVGERQVFGMVAETINNNTWGLVQVKGKTTVLKATNAGGGNIVIGDNLITENGVRARKAAAATDPIFAQALEACAAADCTLDAYIVSPWD